MMQRFKQYWQIQAHWQFLFPILGLLGLLATSYWASETVLGYFHIERLQSMLELIKFVLVGLFFFVFLKLVLRLFGVLASRWKVNFRWELIAIFIVFAITGSVAARFSAPILSLLGVSKSSYPILGYWCIRILVMFPLYQIVLLVTGWLFGQFRFFWNFEKKMLRRFGFHKLSK